MFMFFRRVCVQERALLFNTLNQAQKAIRLRMEVATSDNLLRLITMGVRAIHYTGHGMPACLAFEDEEGKMHPMDPAQLKELVEAGRGGELNPDGSRPAGVDFVFVSACHSESAGNAFVQAGVPHVIAVKTDAAVCDKASQIFMNHVGSHTPSGCCTAAFPSLDLSSACSPYRHLSLFTIGYHLFSSTLPSSWGRQCAHPSTSRKRLCGTTRD